MKFRSLLLAGALLTAAGANAQMWVSDSITQGPAYATDVWYSLENGTADTAANNTWTMAFQSTPQGPFGNVAVWANHARAGAQVWVLPEAATFDAVAVADTNNTANVRVWNSAKSWNYGAFNDNADPTSQIDYGWGIYDIDEHDVYGNRVFIMKTGGMWFKVAILSYITDSDGNSTDTTNWNFRIAKIDGTEDTTIRIDVADYGTKIFAYYNAITRTMLDREPAKTTWDVLFTRYTDSLDLGGGIGPNTTTGVLLNHGVKAAQVNDISPDTVMYSNYAFGDTLNLIGWDWKFQPGAPGVFATDTNRTYFIKTTDGDYWQMVFTGFTGTSNSKTIFKKRKVAMTGVAAVNSSVQRFLVAPVPANNNLNLVLEAANGAGHGQVAITDMAGRVVYQASIQVGAGMNAYGIQTGNLPEGNYILTARGEGFAVSQKVVIAR